MINLDKLRKLSKNCSDNKKTQEYIREVCFKIKNILIDYATDTKQNKNKILEKYLGYEAAPKSFSTGQIPTKYINDVINNGNIREQITLIMNFSMSSCSVILWAVEKNKYFTQESIDMLHKRLYNLTGIHSIVKINKYIKNCEKKGYIVPSKFITLALDSSVSASRMSINDKLREPRLKNIKKIFCKC